MMFILIHRPLATFYTPFFSPSVLSSFLPCQVEASSCRPEKKVGMITTHGLLLVDGVERLQAGCRSV